MHELHVSYSNSAARARGARVQILKRWILRWNYVTHLLIFKKNVKACDNVIRVTNIFPNS